MTITRFAALAILTSVLLNIVPAAEAAAVPFPDMEHSWYRFREAVQYLKDQDVIGGYADGTFKPRETINRAELLKIVFKGKSDIVPAKRRCFRDVRPDAWYAPYVCAAKQRGIVDGYRNGTFKPGEPVNHAEAIKIILNAYGQDVKPGVGQLWYLPYAESLENLDILPQHAYVPWAPLTREHAADLIWRMLRYQKDRVIPRLSPGCGKAPPMFPSTTVTVRDQSRSFLLNIPSGYIAHDPAPLVVAFHGRTNNNEQVRQYMRLDRNLSDSFIAYPAGIKNGGGSFTWTDPGDKAQEIRDIAFFDAIVEQLATDYCIDMDRISVVGHSLGAWIANSIACVRGDVVMASATVGGDSVSTTCNGPASAMIIHNPKDNLASFAGAENVRKKRMETNFCSWESVPGPSLLNCERYNECAGGNAILWCPHTINTDHRGEYYPHVWPSETAQYIADFFRSLK